MLVTVAICTWNRAALLDQTLTHMHSLRVPPGVDWELLVVNNNCTDVTDEVVARHASRLPIRPLREEQPGLSHARNCASAAARGELLIWADDDVLVDPDWMVAYVDAMRQWPGASYFGGTVEPWFAADPPGWILRNLGRLSGPYAINLLGDSVRPLEAGEYPYGANMAFVTRALGGRTFDPMIGRKHDDMVSGEEYDFIDKMRDGGHLGVWVGTARVKHFIPDDRLNERYLWERIRGGGRTELRMAGYNGARIFGVPRWAIRAYLTSHLQLMLRGGRRDGRWFDAFSKTAHLQGIIVEAWQNGCKSRD